MLIGDNSKSGNILKHVDPESVKQAINILKENPTFLQNDEHISSIKHILARVRAANQNSPLKDVTFGNEIENLKGLLEENNVIPNVPVVPKTNDKTQPTPSNAQSKFVKPKDAEGAAIHFSHVVSDNEA